MRKLIGGHAFEAEVIRVLRRELACDVFASETLDLDHKVDGEIRGVGTARFARPVQYQVTRRIDHYTKLRKYLKTRWLNTDIVSLYVEAEPERLPAELAEDLAWAAVTLQTLPPYGDRPHFGLRVGEDAVFFDPYVRLAELKRERESEERLKSLRRGIAHAIVKDGFTVSGEDGSSRFAHFIEVDDGSFRSRLRERAGDDEASFPVLFLPHGRFARDIRLRACEEGPEDPGKEGA